MESEFPVKFQYKMIKRPTYLLFILPFLMITGCSNPKNNKLPILGRKSIQEKTGNGTVKFDTIYHEIENFAFTNQDSMKVTNSTFNNKVYVADFFFTTCPTICPIMKTQMLRVYNQFEHDDGILFLSHTIDPDYDTVALLHDFADRLGVSSKKWHFVTGPKEYIYEIGQNSYMVTAMEDENEPGGYLHSGAFILVDPDRHIRGLYDGTKEDQVDRLISDIPKLLQEYGL
jgi:protein SCO1/2